MYVFSLNIITIPLQDLLLLSSRYPLLQEHWKLPTVLAHICSHGDGDVAHSSISTNYKIILSLSMMIAFNIIKNKSA